jgi:hypothetical protein
LFEDQLMMMMMMVVVVVVVVVVVYFGQFTMLSVARLYSIK